MEKKESLYEIGHDIQSHRNKEIHEYVQNCAIARAFCHYSSSLQPEKNGYQTFWLVNKSWAQYNNRRDIALQTDGQSVCKNTRMGEILIKYFSGKQKYTQTNLRGYRKGKVNEVEIEIFNRAQYNLTPNSVKEITINIDGEAYRYQTLKQLLNEKEAISERLETLKKQQEETKKALEAAEEERKRKKQEEEEAEKARLLAEKLRKQREEEERQIEELKQKETEALERIAQSKAFLRQGAELRSQHILDCSQEDAKRSDLFNGIPVLIEGGPGTGKTTTMIQRLNFLLSNEALRDYENGLTDKQIEEITNPQTRDTKWLYFSPTKDLLAYLRNNMANEGLHAGENNSTIIDDFARHMLTAYKLNVPDQNGPFLKYKQGEGEECLIKEANIAIVSFERFLVRKIAKALVEVSKLQTNNFPWHAKAVSIKSYCQKAEEIKDITALMNLLNSMKSNETSTIKENEKKVNDLKNLLAVRVQNLISADESMISNIKKLFEKWDDEDEDGYSDDSIDEEDLNDGEDTDITISAKDFILLLNRNLKSILRNLSLKTIDSKQKLSKRQTELYAIVKEHVDAQDITLLGQMEWFSKKFAYPCRGIESNIFNQIPKIYKDFRKEILKIGATSFNLPLLKKIVVKDNNKRLHREEIELLVGFINNLIYDIYKKSKLRFESMHNNKYVKAYMENVKPVIVVDEATDYSLIDYYFMASFRHYEFNTMTLCGDIMQGLNNYGIESWEQLKKYILPNLKIFELKVSYRQTPTLLDLSKRLYLDDQGMEAPYHSLMNMSNDEPQPICYISDDPSKKIRWMAKRICEFYKHCNDELPALAILVGDEVDVDDMVSEMQDMDILNGFSVFNCTGGRTTNAMKCIRIFRISEVKGMEFEAVFFYDIDEALAGQSHKMLRRYLYVGVSRATSHLAVTFTKEEGNEDIIKYFDTNKRNWK
ncbi:ATP-binding domain-containing protein [uncultured Prevotella sp.]|uniref:ATP-binding domain-containing protein n=1 Tax=uncultured Prevotella sp. TaxID=159272 RepID=UPI0027DAD844|nr:ATP-binding domain-containing protein [uncultured Prevotella sp.]